MTPFQPDDINKHLPTVEVCLSPALLPYHSSAGKIVVVIDVFRASSAIITALEYGVSEIIPVREIEDALEYRSRGFIAAAERNGEIAPGFTFGNSPYAFMKPELRGLPIVLTTSNCTSAIHKVQDAEEIWIGAFTNITAVIEALLDANKSVLLLCAGWKNRFSLEDTLCAGAMAKRLEPYFPVHCDSSLAAKELYENARNDMRGYLRNSSHAVRLQHLNIEEDIRYCLLKDQATVIPCFEDGALRPRI